MAKIVLINYDLSLEKKRFFKLPLSNRILFEKKNRQKGTRHSFKTCIKTTNKTNYINSVLYVRLFDFITNTMYKKYPYTMIYCTLYSFIMGGLCLLQCTMYIE
jgi:hypothetical protein